MKTDYQTSPSGAAMPVLDAVTVAMADLAGELREDLLAVAGIPLRDVC